MDSREVMRMKVAAGKIKGVIKGVLPFSGVNCGRYLFGVFLLSTVVLVLNGCASMRLPRVAAVPIDQFEPFALSDAGAITPESANRDIPTADILELSSEMKDLVDTSVASIKDPAKRLNALAEILSDRVRYNTSADKYGIKTAKETFESGTGNCLSFSNMFIAMARYAGLNAQYQEIPTPPNWTRTGEVLFFALHIGAFVDVLDRPDYTVHLYAGQANRVVVWNTATRYMFTPSEWGPYNPEANPLSARPIPDHRAFAQYYNNIGSMHLADGNNADAFRYFIKAINIDPKLNFAWSNLGVVYSRNNQHKAAEAAYQQGLSVSRGPDDVSVMTIMSNMAKLYYRIGDAEKSDFFEKEVASFRKRNPYYHYSIAKTAFQDALYEDSVKHFKDAIQRKDDEHLFYYGLALAYFKMGDLKNVEKNLNRAKRHAWDDGRKDYYERVWEELSGNVDF
jgi:tetratricopeptide (TPR) repeat protein